MHKLSLLITLQEPAIFSAGHGTDGAHSSVTYIPGATLLGAAAVQLYPSLKNRSDVSFALFHSGQVRFHHGMPAIPPQSKNKPDTSSSRGEGSEAETNAKMQYFEAAYPLPVPLIKPCKEKNDHFRQHYLSLEDQEPPTKPQKGQTLKTAINSETATAEQQQLFNFEFVEAIPDPEKKPTLKQRYIAEIHIDENCPHAEAMMVLLKDVFDRKYLFLGRSRSAEFGRCWSEVIEAVEIGDEPALDPDKPLYLWLVSQACLADAHGMPTTDITAQTLGVSKDVTVDNATVTTGRFAVWNATREAHDPERLALLPGSVITVRGCTDADRTRLSTQGIGLYRESGLGRVIVLYNIGTDKEPKLKPLQTTHVWQRPSVAVAQTALGALIRKTPYSNRIVSVLRDRTQEASGASRAEGYAAQWFDDFCKLYHNSRLYKGAREGEAIGPSRSQWGDLEQRALRERNRIKAHRPYDWQRFLREVRVLDTPHKDKDRRRQGQARIGWRDWARRPTDLPGNGDHISFGDLLLSQMQEVSPSPLALASLIQLARKARSLDNTTMPPQPKSKGAEPEEASA